MLTSEFRRRLIRLHRAILVALDKDSAGGNLLPSLFSVYTFLWCNSKYEKFKK